MKKLLLIAGLLAASAILFTGCGSSANEIRYALVTGSTGTSDNSALTSIASGIESYCRDNSYITKTYTAPQDTAEGYKNVFDSAASDEARYVVAEGTDMETAVYEAQNTNHDCRYLFFDGEPKQSEDSTESSIRSNTECISFNKTEMGFLAGYAPIRDGMRKIMFLSGTDEGDTDLYYQGFVRGIAYAMNEQNLGITEVTVNVEWCGSNDLTPRRLADALDQYSTGTELIVTDQEQIAEAVNRAAASSGTYFATVGFDGTSEFDHCSFSAVADYENAVKNLFGQIDNHHGFSGGENVTLGAADNAVTVSGDFSHFTSFNANTLQTILNAMGDNDLASGSEGTSTESGTASSGASEEDGSNGNGNGEGAASGSTGTSGAGTSAANGSVAIHEIRPTTGNVSAGSAEIGAQTVSGESLSGTSGSESGASSAAESQDSESGTGSMTDSAVS